MDVVIPYGTSVHSKKDCMEHRCGRDALQTLACAVAMYDLRDRPNCYIFEDHKKPYPGCCPQIKCPAKTDSP
ncbi:hypothetical protein O3G_MSEX000241 [Manduca sexta]|nr:hypothetical protein O3G_MSEX000241 [Manduca sexta]